jgi:hypothetical protein
MSDTIKKIANANKDLYDFIEVEIRYKLSTAQIIKFLLANKDNFEQICSISQTINIIYSGKNRESYITSKGYMPISDVQHSIKKMLIKDSGLVSISVSGESTLVSINKNPAVLPLYRLKNRLVVPWENGKFEITQVVKIEDTEVNSQVLSLTKMELFNKHNFASENSKEIFGAFLDNMTNPIITEVELEYEFDNFAYANYDMDYAIDLLSGEIAIEVRKNITLSKLISDFRPNQRNYGDLKSFLNQAVTLSKNEYNKIYPPIDWYITPKSDGFAGLLKISPANSYIFTQHNACQITSFGSESPQKEFIFVGEFDEKAKTFHIFDVLMWEGEKCDNLKFHERHTHIASWQDVKVEASDQTGEKLAIVLAYKPHILITSDLQRSFKSALEMDFAFETDGFIMVSPSESYFATRNYKIKEHNTIDFLVVPMEGGVYYLFASANKFELTTIQMIPEYPKIFPQYVRANGLVPVHFCPADDPKAYIWKPNAKTAKLLQEESKKEGKLICELEYIDGQWELIKVRDDRRFQPNYFGNHLFRTAEAEWLISKDRLLIKDMHLTQITYFEQEKSSLYYAQVNAVSAGKALILKQLSHLVSSKTFIDLASGKGQDLWKYEQNGYKSGVFLEIDPVALNELVSRRTNAIMDRTKRFDMKVQIGRCDVGQPAEKTIELLRPLTEREEVSLVVCNLAIHYIITTLDKLHNFIKLIIGILADGGYFTYTCFSGKAILELLGDADQWSYHQDNLLKYHIVKKFSGNTLAEFGQTVELKVPFSNDLYAENLVNIEFVNAQFCKFGFELVASESMSVFASELAKSIKFSGMSKEDKQYVSLYHYTILRKKGQPTVRKSEGKTMSSRGRRGKGAYRR